MIVLSHRGYWREAAEKNTTAAFERSFAMGFGTETDVRDFDRQLVISHDIPSPGCIPLRSVLELLKGRRLPLAVNIKADGLSAAIRECVAMIDAGLDYFVFDMSVPDMRHHLQAGLPVFGRLSEEERELPWADRCSGIWLDAFSSTWYDRAAVQNMLEGGKRVCVVSPELHRREHEDTWKMLKPLASHPLLMICTDIPEAATEFFGVSA